jgi:hypothetical protein
MKLLQTTDKVSNLGSYKGTCRNCKKKKPLSILDDSEDRICIECQYEDDIDYTDYSYDPSEDAPFVGWEDDEPSVDEDDIDYLDYLRRNPRLNTLRRRRLNLDPTRLTAFSRNRRHRGHRRNSLDPTRLVAFRRRNSYRRNPCGSSRRKPYRRNPYRRNPYRRNPDPEGKPWGPQLYNPITDSTNKFKNERHYTKMISKLRRNPW